MADPSNLPQYYITVSGLELIINDNWLNISYVSVLQWNSNQMYMQYQDYIDYSNSDVVFSGACEWKPSYLYRVDDTRAQGGTLEKSLMLDTYSSTSNIVNGCFAEVNVEMCIHIY